MDCKEVCNKMCDYIEHQLSQKEILIFEKHMKDCKQCQEEYYRLEKLIIKLKNIKDIEPPDNLKIKILDSIRNEVDKKDKKLNVIYLKKYSYVAVTLIFFISGFYILKNVNKIQIPTRMYSVIKIGDNKSSKSLEEKTDLSDNIDLKKEKRYVESKEKLNTSRALQIDNSDSYLYEKKFSKEDNMENFKYDIPLYNDEVCNVYFENDSDNNIILFIENIDGKKVSNDIIVEKDSSNNMRFYMKEGDLEQDVYTVNVQITDKNIIEGYLKIEILPKN